MRVLGIDPGIATTGWGFVEKTSPQTSRLLCFGAILTPAKDGMVDRLQSISRQLQELIRTHQPAVAAIEELFFAKNSATAAAVGHARGVLLLTLAEAGLPIHEYNPRQVKMSLTGFGAADKPQMQRMVQRFLGLKDIPKPDDAADAVAIALCHINTFRPATAA
jgi:crossover junction endodeoxyribonuclease RuvC